jgi:hypothetical protein
LATNQSLENVTWKTITDRADPQGQTTGDLIRESSDVLISNHRILKRATGDSFSINLKARATLVNLFPINDLFVLSSILNGFRNKAKILPLVRK